MKFKKFIALIISLTIIVSAFSILPVSASSDTELQSRISFLNSLGIDSVEALKYQTTISRAQFISIALSVLGIDSASYTYGGEYIDVSYDSAYSNSVAAALANSLLTVDFSRRFNPDRTVTVGEASKILVCGLGYGAYADLNGGYPVGYLSAARKLDIIDGTVYSDTDTLTPAMAVDMLYNALHAPLLIPDGIDDDTISFNKDDSVTLLTDRLNLTAVTGTVLSTGMYSVLDNYTYNSELININGTEYKCNIPNSDYYFAKNVTAWINKSGEVKALDVSDNMNTAELDSDDIYSFTGDSVSVYEDNKSRKYTLDKGFSLIENGTILPVNPSNYDFESGNVTLIDNNGDKKYDVLNVKKIKYLVVDRVSAEGRIYDANREEYTSGTYITAERDSEHNYSVKLYGEDGMLTSGTLEDIKKDMVLSVYEKSDSSFVEIIASSVAINGKADEYNDEYIKIDGIDYEMNEYFKKHFSTMSPGTEGRFGIAYDGTLTYVGSPKGADMKYGYLIDVDKNTGLDATIVVKLLTSAGDRKIFNLANKVSLDGNNVLSSSDEVESVLYNGEYPKYGLIKYSVNEDGAIDKLDTPTQSYAGEPLEDSFAKNIDNRDNLRQYMNKNQFWFKYYARTAVGNFNFGNTIIFRAPIGVGDNPEDYYDENFFSVDTIAYLADDDKCLADSFDYNSDFQPAAIVLYDVEGGAVGDVAENIPGVYAPTYMVDRVSESINADGEVTTKLILNNGTNYSTKFIAPDLNELFKKNNKIPTPGDIIRISESTTGTINGLLIDVDYNNATGDITINYTNSGLENNLTARTTYMKGKVYSSSASMVSIVADAIPSTSLIDTPYKNLFVYKASDNSAVMFDRELEEVRPIYVSGFLGIQNSTEEQAYDVVIKCSSGTFAMAYVYSK